MRNTLLIASLQQSRLAQTASIDQQREIMRYLHGLNSWLERDVRDRQEEIRSIGARVDALRNEMRQGFIPQFGRRRTLCLLFVFMAP